MIDDKFYDCKYSEEDYEQFEDEKGYIDYERLRFCSKGCNPYLDCFLNCKFFERGDGNA